MTTDVLWPQIIMYVLLYFILIFFIISVYYLISKVFSEKAGLFFVFLFCVIYGGIRYYVGSDYENYLINYMDIMNSGNSFLQVLSRDKEIGFNALLFLTARITKYDYGIFWTTSIIIYFLIINAIKKYSSNIILSLFLFFVLGYHLFSMNGVRQSIALFLFIYLVYMYFERKYIKVMILAVLMCLFHTSSILILILFVIINKLNIKFNKNNYFGMIIFSIVLYFIYPNLIQIFLKAIEKFPYFSRYYDYFSSFEIVDQSNRMTLAVIVIGIMYISITGLFLASKHLLIKSNPTLEKILPLLLIGFPFVFIGIRTWPTVRMAFYVFQLTIFILPSYISAIKKRYNNNNLMIFIIILCLIIYSGIYIILYRDNWYFQYSTYLFK